MFVRVNDNRISVLLVNKKRIPYGTYAVREKQGREADVYKFNSVITRR